MLPEQIVNAQADLLTRMGDWKFHKALTGSIITQAGTEEGSETAALAIESHVQAAYAYRVTKDMVDLVAISAARLEDDDEMDISLSPTGCGIVHFEKPLVLKDSMGNHQNIDWVTWGPVTTRSDKSGRSKPAIIVSMWNDMTHPDQVGLEVLRAPNRDAILSVIGDWGFIGTALYVHGELLGPPEVKISEEDLNIYLDADQEEEVSVADLVPHTNCNRWMHALWLMLGQTITDTREEYVRKTAMRRARLMNIPGKVTVVQLRRVEYRKGDGDGAPVLWTHRWYVRGHWRWQVCGTGRSERKRIWVNPFIKGPENAPLIVTDKVYDLSR